MAVGAYAQCEQSIAKIDINGNSSVQFVLNTATQLQASETVLSGHTRIKISFRQCENDIYASGWQLNIKSQDTHLSLDGASTSVDGIEISNVEIKAELISETNTSTSFPLPITLSPFEQPIAWGSIGTATTEIMEAELLLSYKLTCSMWGRKSGTYFTNIDLQLKEH